MQQIIKSDKINKILTDTMWSFAGLALMNIGIQLVVYPVFSKVLGDEGYGNALYLLSFVDIVGTTVGVGTASARMVASIRGKTHNGDYNWFLLAACAFFVPVAILVELFGGVQISVFETILFYFLMCTSTWRNYVAVQFRLNLEYKNFFWYYVAITIGDILGITLFLAARQWALVLLLGDLFSIIFVLKKGDILNRCFYETSDERRANLHTIVILMSSTLLSTLIFNADRLLLKTILGATAVTTYYLATLLGKTMSMIVTPLGYVMIGYLVRYKGTINKKKVFYTIILLLGATVVFSLVCVAGSHVFLFLFYPQNYAQVKPYLILCSFSQVLYISTGVFTVILLRFAEQRYQFYINASYAVISLAMAVPAALKFGIWGFAVAMFAANILRFIIVTGFGLRQAGKDVTP